MARCWMYQCPPNSQRPSHLHEPPNVLQRSIWRSSKSFSSSLASNIESSINGLPSRQLSGYCLSQLEALEAQPTTSPTTNDRTVDYWYPGEGVQTESWANDLAGLTYIALLILQITTLPGLRLDVSIASPSPFRLVTVRPITNEACVSSSFDSLAIQASCHAKNKANHFMGTLVFRGIRHAGKKTHVGICVLLLKYLLFIPSTPSGFKGVSLQHGESRGRLHHACTDTISISFSISTA